MTSALTSPDEPDAATSGQRTSGSLSLDQYPTADARAPVRIFQPSEAARGTIVLLHGFPGTELNFDIAHAARRAGFVVLLPHYRGAWGAPGAFSWQSALDDVASLIAWTRTDEVRARHSLPDLTLLCGHSLGGFAALMCGAADRGIKGVAAMAAFNFGGYEAHMLSTASEAQLIRDIGASWQSSTTPLSGTSGPALAAEFLRHGPEWDLKYKAQDFRGRAVLLIAADFDEVAEPTVHHEPMARAYRTALGDGLSEFQFATDHGFVSHRARLVECIVGWAEALTRVEVGACATAER